MSSTAPSIQLQDRDLKLLRGLFECRIMTIRQITAIYFEGHFEATRKRVRLLKYLGHVAERPRNLNDRSILSITQKGFDALKRNGRLDGHSDITSSSFKRRIRVADTTLQHELDVMEAKASFHSMARAVDLQILEFTTWPKRIEFSVTRPDTRASMITRPDGFIHLQTQKRNGNPRNHRFFLEVDRSTESLKVLANRIACYWRFYKEGGFSHRLGKERSAFRQFPYRVLITCQSIERRNSIAIMLAATVAVRNFVCLSTLGEVTTNPLAPVWVTPAAYRNESHRSSLDDDVAKCSLIPNCL